MSYFLGQTFFYLVYLPHLYLLKTILFFVPKVKERREFEKKNQIETGAQSFALSSQKADLCFEFSSEGELQQVASLIEDALKDGKNLELVFFSPSVEKAIVALQAKFPKQIRYLRYPLLSNAFSKWVTAETLVLVRYDLFPEFFFWSLKKTRKLKMIWVSFKKERVKNKSLSFYKKLFLKRASSLVFASEADTGFGNNLGFEGITYDFRMEQIRRRMVRRLEKFKEHFHLYPEFKAHLDTFPRGKRLIMGNAWPMDLFLLKDLPADCLVVIVPHKLTPEIIEGIENRLRGLGRMPETITDSTMTMPKGNTLIINKKGILCELYQDFGKAYIGGGFGVSVHSILEPLVAGSDQISCGPTHHRSTEFDLAMAWGSLKEVKNSQEFQLWLLEDILTLAVHDKLSAQVQAYPTYMKEVLSC